MWQHILAVSNYSCEMTWPWGVSAIEFTLHCLMTPSDGFVCFPLDCVTNLNGPQKVKYVKVYRDVHMYITDDTSGTESNYIIIFRHYFPDFLHAILHCVNIVELLLPLLHYWRHTRSPTVARKATVDHIKMYNTCMYCVWRTVSSCRTLNNRAAEICTSGIAMWQLGDCDYSRHANFGGSVVHSMF